MLAEVFLDGKLLFDRPQVLPTMLAWPSFLVTSYHHSNASPSYQVFTQFVCLQLLKYRSGSYSPEILLGQVGPKHNCTCSLICNVTVLVTQITFWQRLGLTSWQCCCAQ